MVLKILIADKLSGTTVSELEKLGGTVTVDPELTTDTLPGAIGDAEVLIVRSTKVTATVIAAAPALSLIIRAGAGVNTIDIETANERGIHVANCPGKNTDSVAELAIGHLINADRRIGNATRDIRAGKWGKKEYGKSRGLKGRTLGILGVGSIGKAVIRRAIGLEMNVIGWSRSLTQEKAGQLGIGFCSTPLELASRADAVSVHLAATDETTHLVGEAFLNALKEGAVFINTSRGEVVDTDALKKAVKERSLRVGLDVFENEPSAGTPDFDDPELAEMVFATPHIGASTDQAAEAIAAEVVNIVQSYVDTGRPLNVVNIQERSPAVNNLVVRHFNRVGVLAGVLDELRNAGINIEEMENHIFEGGHAAACSLRLDDTPSEEVLDRIGTSDDVIQVTLK
jgi:D-3-phosphoglycerate dehydrogenase / 2-oxoglutarate reductase